MVAQRLAMGALLAVLIIAGSGVASTPLLPLLLLLLRTVARRTTGAVLQGEPLPWSHHRAIAADA